MSYEKLSLFQNCDTRLFSGFRLSSSIHKKAKTNAKRKLKIDKFFISIFV